jgi:hypothetical protein
MHCGGSWCCIQLHLGFTATLQRRDGRLSINFEDSVLESLLNGDGDIARSNISTVGHWRKYRGQSRRPSESRLCGLLA